MGLDAPRVGRAAGSMPVKARKRRLKNERRRGTAVSGARSAFAVDRGIISPQGPAVKGGRPDFAI